MCIQFQFERPDCVTQQGCKTLKGQLNMHFYSFFVSLSEQVCFSTSQTAPRLLVYVAPKESPVPMS